MMYRPVLVTPPAIKPVTLTEAKAALDVGYTAKDDLINGLIAAATSHLDGWTGILGRALCEQTWRQDFDYFWARMPLPLFPVLSITSVKYLDTSGVQQTVDPSNYSLQANDLGCYVQSLTTFNPPSVYTEPPQVSVTYKSGYANAGSDPDITSTVPEAIKQAILLLVRHWFDNPSAVIVGQTVASLPFAVDALISPYRRTRF